MQVPVNIQSSTRHGRGVFAIKDIPKYTHLTIYGNIVVDDSHDDDYTMKFPDGSLRSGDPDTNDPALCGHMLNDYMSLWFEGPLSLSDARRIVSGYIDSENENNAIFGDESGNLIAARDIFQGEEITLFYGIQYWLSRIANGARLPCTRFIALVLRRENGVNDPATLITSMQHEEQASLFITDFLDLSLDSEFWTHLGVKGHRATIKIQALYSYFLRGGT